MILQAIIILVFFGTSVISSPDDMEKKGIRRNSQDWKVRKENRREDEARVYRNGIGKVTGNRRDMGVSLDRGKGGIGISDAFGKMREEIDLKKGVDCTHMICGQGFVLGNSILKELVKVESGNEIGVGEQVNYKGSLSEGPKINTKKRRMRNRIAKEQGTTGIRPTIFPGLVPVHNYMGEFGRKRQLSFSQISKKPNHLKPKETGKIYDESIDGDPVHQKAKDREQTKSLPPSKGGKGFFRIALFPSDGNQEFNLRPISDIREDQELIKHNLDRLIRYNNNTLVLQKTTNKLLRKYLLMINRSNDNRPISIIQPFVDESARIFNLECGKGDVDLITFKFRSMMPRDSMGCARVLREWLQSKLHL